LELKLQIVYLCIVQLLTNVKKINEMKEFIDNLTLREYELFRRKVMYECCITRVTFANWKMGYPVAKRFQERIDEIAKEITGKTIFK
jgi:hypothetical protein